MPLVRKDPAPLPPSPAAAPRRALLEGGAEARWAAARDLGNAPGDAALLGSALRQEADPRVREAILTSLARVGNAESVEAVLPLLRSDDAELRTEALDALRAMPGASGAHLADLLADGDPDVRLLACELARGVAADEAQRLLCGLLDREAEENVCAAAIEVLAEIGDEGALPALDRCAIRFAPEGFLAFSIQMTRRRITAQTAAPRG